MRVEPSSTVQAVALQGGLEALIALLRRQEFEVVAPVPRQGTTVFARIVHWSEVAPDLFAGPPPAFSLKPWLHEPEMLLFQATRDPGDGALTIYPGGPACQHPRYAFVGVRSCDLAAAARLDRVLLGDRFVDPVYAARRRGSVVVAAACVQPGETCFCESMGTGPRPNSPCDILLEAGKEGEVLATACSPAGEDLLGALETSPASEPAPASPLQQTRQVDTKGLKALLYEAFEHPRWEQTAARCLGCASCTSSCPTCFCISIDEGSSLDGHSAVRKRRWDSCFTHSFSYIHGGSVRLSAKSRLRHRITHKFAAWQDQFGEIGCTGCGRCIQWCPAGIDVTEELAALRAPAHAGGKP